MGMIARYSCLFSITQLAHSLLVDIVEILPVNELKLTGLHAILYLSTHYVLIKFLIFYLQMVEKTVMFLSLKP